MAKVTAPENFRIASMDNQKKEQQVNLMKPGSGMPWEDRGSMGMVPAFFKNLTQALFSPNALLAKMRRPETSSDATAFAIVCCSFWFLGAVFQSIFDYFVRYAPNRYIDVTINSYVLNTALVALLCGGGAFVLLLLASSLFFKLTSHDMVAKAPPVLIRNTLSYLMAPNIFALIPISIKGIPVGPVLAILWMMFLWMVAGRGRLHLPKGGAFVAPILTMGACAAIIFAAFFAIQIVAVNVMNQSSIVDNSLTPPKTAQK